VCAAACTVDREPPNLVGQDVRLTFIHTSDIHSRLFPYNFVPNRFEREGGLVEANAPFGGVARIATIAHDIRDSSYRSLWIDSGDCFKGAPVFNIFKGKPDMRTITTSAMHATVNANHEFDLGTTILYEQIDNGADTRLPAANYLYEDPTNPDQRSLRHVVRPNAVFDGDVL